MKKIILSTIIAGLLSSALMASDTTALTRSTVKLIKAYHSIETKMNSISTSNLNNKNDISTLQGRTNAIDNRLNGIDDFISSNSGSISQNANNIRIVTEGVRDARLKAISAESLAKSNEAILLEVRGIKTKVLSTSDTAYTKANNLEERVILVETSLTEATRTAKTNEALISSIRDRVSILEKELDLHKNLSDKRFEELEQKLVNAQLRFEAEARVLRAKLDRTNPVYVINREASKSCQDGNCGTVPEADQVIDKFLSSDK